jgi:putative surface cell wall-binding protein
MRTHATLIGVISLSALALGAAARAATVGVTASVVGGSTLSVAANGTPSFSLTLNGDDQTKTYTLPVQVVDARGLASGGGWNLTITSTTFSDGAGHSLAANASNVTGVAPTCATGSTCNLPTNAIAYPLAVPAAASAPAAVKFYNAASPTGRGRVNVNAAVNVDVPANTIAGTYTSTVTVSIVAGP